MPAKERLSLYGHHTYTESEESEPVKSKNYMIKKQKGKRRKHLTEEKLGPRDNKFNVTEEACFRGRNLRPRTGPSPGWCSDIGNTGCLQVSFSSEEEVGSWDKLRKKVHLAMCKNVCIQETRKVRIFFPFNEGHSFKQKLKGKHVDRKEPKPYNWEAGSTAHAGFSSIVLCDSYLWEKNSFLPQFLPT